MSSLRHIQTIAYAKTKKKQIVKAMRGCCMSIKHVPMTQPIALPMAPKIVVIVCMSPRPFSISFLLYSTNSVSFSDTIISPKKQSTTSVAKNR